MEVIFLSETLVLTVPTSPECTNPEDQNYLHRRENLKYHVNEFGYFMIILP